MEEQLNYERIEKAIEYLSKNFKTQPSLDEVAEIVNISPFHFQRIFTEWAGVSPKKFLQFLTIDFLKSQIKKTKSIAEVAEIAGLSSQSRVYDLFVTIEGVTPDQYKNDGIGLKIFYGFHKTPFGECLIAVTEKGICGLAFINVENKNEILNQFIQKWSFAIVECNQEYTKNWIEKIFSFNSIQPQKLNILVQGTNFQIKVWEALLKIPFGALTTYEQLAILTENSKAMRAVGSAVGKNPIAFLIPCHRVIRKEGKVGEYHWGKNRKQAIIGWEASKINNEGNKIC